MAGTITVKDVRTAIKACATASRLQHEADAAAEIKSAALLAVFEPLLGVKTSAEVARLSRDEICALASRRVKKGDVLLEGFELGQLFEVIVQTQCRRNVSWKDAFTAECGEAKAKELQSGAYPSYSYKFEETLAIPARAHARAMGAVNA